LQDLIGTSDWVKEGNKNQTNFSSSLFNLISPNKPSEPSDNIINEGLPWKHDNNSFMKSGTPLFPSSSAPFTNTIFGNPTNNGFQPQMFTQVFPQVMPETNFSGMATFPSAMIVDSTSSFMARPIEQNPFIQQYHPKEKSLFNFENE
jgi:hypothetical protein